MVRRRARAPLNVFLNGRLVGRLTLATTGAIDFQYDPTWLGWEHALPVSLSLPLREDRFIGAPVVAVFDNLLPDNDDIRRRLAARVGAEGTDAFNLLSAIGRDCVGALQFLPDGADIGKTGEISGRTLDEAEIERLLSDLGRAPLGLGSDREFRISLAGAQEKTALLYRDGRWYMPLGATATTHILKPQIGTLNDTLNLSQSVENEHFCLELTAALGLASARTTIADFGKRRVLVVERFDRQWTTDGRLLRRPQEDFCQALSYPPTLKYESDRGPGIRAMMELLKASDDPDMDQRRFLKSQIVFWLVGAIDGHAKNFSLHLAPGGRFALAPLYDVVSAQPYADAKQLRRNEMKLAMAIGRNRHYVVEEIQPRHFAQTAELCGLSADLAQSIFEELHESTPKAIDDTLNTLPDDFPAAIADAIVQGVKRRLAAFNTENPGF